MKNWNTASFIIAYDSLSNNYTKISKKNLKIYTCKYLKVIFNVLLK